MRIKSLLLLLFVCAFARGQQLTYLGGGKFSYEGRKLDGRQLEFLLQKKPALLDEYDTAKTKRNVGNVMYVAGTLLAGGSLVAGLTSDHFSPGAAIGGVGAIILAVPIKAGFRKRMRHVASAYNERTGAADRGFPNISLCAGRSALGVKISF
jgi:hypothetical protein